MRKKLKYIIYIFMIIVLVAHFLTLDLFLKDDQVTRCFILIMFELLLAVTSELLTLNY